MKVYKFIFLVGFLNLAVPFLGVPFVYKNYILLSLAVITLGYGLILRTIEHERKMAKLQYQKEKTIEDVIEMEDRPLRTKRKKVIQE